MEQDTFTVDRLNGRFNDARTAQLLIPLYKKFLKIQNPLEVFFRKSKFDKKIPVIGSLLDEIDSKKEEKSTLKKFRRQQILMIWTLRTD